MTDFADLVGTNEAAKMVACLRDHEKGFRDSAAGDPEAWGYYMAEVCYHAANLIEAQAKKLQEIEKWAGMVISGLFITNESSKGYAAAQLDVRTLLEGQQ